MAKASKDAQSGSGSEEAEERRRREERLASFYQGPKQGPPPPAAEAEKPKTPKTPSLSDPDPVFRSEFNTVSYLAIGFSMVALLLFGILFFRPPKPEAELKALQEAQMQNRAVLEELSSHVTALDRQAKTSEKGDLIRGLRQTSLTLDELKKLGGPAIRDEAEALQIKIEKLKQELERDLRPGTSQ